MGQLVLVPSVFGTMMLGWCRLPLIRIHTGRLDAIEIRGEDGGPILTASMAAVTLPFRLMPEGQPVQGRF